MFWALWFVCTLFPVVTSSPCFGFVTSFAGRFSGSDYSSESQTVYGSELALIFIAEGLARESGRGTVDEVDAATVLVFVELDVDEVVRGVRYLHASRLVDSPSLLGHCDTPGQYTALVVSRYLNVFLDYNLPALSPRVLLWLHDTTPIPYHTSCSDQQCVAASLPDSGFPLLHSLLPSLHSLVTVGHYQKRSLVEEHGFPPDRIAVLPNGLAPDALVDDPLVLTDAGRIPNSFIFSSSPVRQLDLLLALWPDILEVLPDATLRIFYTRVPDHLAPVVASLPSVTVVGKVSHTQLLEEFRRTMFWLYPAKWCETCCSTAFETAVSGVVQVTSSTCALRENVRGVVIPGTPGDGSWSRHALQVITALAGDSKLRDEVRRRQHDFAAEQLWSSRARVWHDMLTAPDTRYNRTSSAFLNWSHDHWLSVPVDITNRANWPFCHDWQLGGEQHDFVDLVGERSAFRPPTVVN